MTTATLHTKVTYGWSLRWRTRDWEALLGKFNGNFHNKHPLPDYIDGYTVMVFPTRQKARDFCKKHFGYIKERKDLQEAPHNWKMPKVVKVMVTVQEVVCRSKAKN